jgi:hypothetical protein
VAYTDYSEKDDADFHELEWSVGAEYSFDQYGLYCEYEFPDQANEKVTLGVAYHF